MGLTDTTFNIRETFNRTNVELKLMLMISILPRQYF